MVMMMMIIIIIIVTIIIIIIIKLNIRTGITTLVNRIYHHKNLQNFIKILEISPTSKINGFFLCRIFCKPLPEGNFRFALKRKLIREAGGIEFLFYVLPV